MPWYDSKPPIWRYLLVFEAISQIWHIEILLSGKFQENCIVGSEEIENYSMLFSKTLNFDLVIWYKFVESPTARLKLYQGTIFGTKVYICRS